MRTTSPSQFASDTTSMQTEGSITTSSQGVPPEINPDSPQVSEDNHDIEQIPETDNDANDDSDVASSISQSSTVVWEHEPFDSYKARVLNLCRDLWPTSDSSEFQIDRLRGGGFNRIIGITSYPGRAQKYSARHFLQHLRLCCGFCLGRSKREMVREYILRIPRMDDADISYEIAMFRYVAEHTSLPVPVVLRYDLTKENAIGHFYSIQIRIPGSDLCVVWDTLNQQQKISATREWARLLLEMQQVRAPYGGFVSPRSIQDGRDGKPEFLRIEVPAREFYEGTSPLTDITSSSQPESILEFYQDLAARMNAHDVGYENGPLKDYKDMWIKVGEIAKEMDEMGFFSNTKFSLCHLDFHARNVIVQVRDEKSVIIQSILDWDSAIFAPQFMVCAAPHWIWTPDDECDEDDESQALTTPKTVEAQELKRVFETSVGPDALRYFYGPQYRMARVALHLLIRGNHCDWDREQYDTLVKDWKDFRSTHYGATSENPVKTISMG